MNTIRCALKDIRLDGGTQPRAGINEEVVADYTQAILRGDEMPPLVVFWDGVNRWLADGFHRHHAHAAAGTMEVEVKQHTGTKRDAILFAVGANAHHGLRLTNEDKRRSIRMLLEDPEWSQWSDRKIAELTHSTHPTVSRVRAELEGRVEKVSTPKAEKPAPEPPREAPTTPEAVERVEKFSTPDSATAAEPQAQTPADDSPSATDLLEELQRENEQLQATIKAAESDDTKAEVVKWKRIADAAQRGQSEAMERAAKAVERESWTMRQLRRCGKAVGQEDPDKIAAAVEAMARAVRGKVAA
jgi:hypothetical protein